MNTIVIPTFDIGDRVIAQPTPGAKDPAYRAGGPGEIVDIRPDERSGEPLAYVTLDDGQDTHQAYHFHELRREPPV